jgi:hypothetical protein
MLFYDTPYIILGYLNYFNLYLKLLQVIINYYTLNYYMLFYYKISWLTYYKFFTLNYFKFNYSTNCRLYLRLFYFKLIYLISSYTLSYSRSLYFMLL